MQNPYQTRKSNIAPTAGTLASIGKGYYVLLFFLTVLICMVIPFLFSLGHIAYYNFDYLYDYPISGPLRDMFIRYDFIFSLLVYIYAFLTRATIKKQYRFFNFFHYLLATLIIYLLFTSMIIFVNNGPIVATFVNWPTYHFRKGVSLGVPVYFVWQLVFNRARKVSLT